jgi:hypothetical protein
MKFGSVLLVTLLAVGASVEAQSLGDMAQKEKEKRAAKAKEGTAKTAKPGDKGADGKVYTTEDLATYADKTAPAAATGEGGEGGDAALPAGSSGDDDRPRVTGSSEEPRSARSEDAAERARQEKVWRGRAQSARAAIAAAEKELAVAEKLKAGMGIGPQTNDEELRRIYADKVRQADQRVTQAREAVATAKTNQTNLEDEARREGAQPGWLR